MLRCRAGVAMEKIVFSTARVAVDFRIMYEVRISLPVGASTCRQWTNGMGGGGGGRRGGCLRVSLVGVDAKMLELKLQSWRATSILVLAFQEGSPRTTSTYPCKIISLQLESPEKVSNVLARVSLNNLCSGTSRGQGYFKLQLRHFTSDLHR